MKTLVCPDCKSQDIECVKHAGYYVCNDCYEHGDKEKFMDGKRR